MKLKTPKCPTCSRIAESSLERFVFDGSADLIVAPDGGADWGGSTEVPWDGQCTITNSRKHIAVGCALGHWWWTPVSGFVGNPHIDDDAIDDPRDVLVTGTYKHFCAKVGDSTIKKHARDSGLKWSSRRKGWFGRPAAARKLRAALGRGPATAAARAIRKAIDEALAGH